MKWIPILGLFLTAALCSAQTATGEAWHSVRAQLTPLRHAVISAEIGAKIEKLHAEEGDTFQEGDILVALDDAVQQAQLQRSEAILKAAERTLTVNKRLLSLNSIGQVELDLSEAEVEKARAEVAHARAMLARCTIFAPYPGRVAEQRVQEQEFVQPAQALLEIIDDAQPEIDFIAPSKWLAWMELGQPLVMRVDETGETYPAVVKRIGARVEPISQTIKVVAIFDGSFPELMAGMSGAVSIQPVLSE